MKPSPLHAFISLSLHHLSRLICQFLNRPVCLGHTCPWFLFISLFTKLNSSHSFCFQSSQVLRERALLASLLPTSLFLLLPTNAYYSSDGICLSLPACLFRSPDFDMSLSHPQCPMSYPTHSRFLTNMYWVSQSFFGLAWYSSFCMCQEKQLFKEWFLSFRYVLRFAKLRC